MILLWHYFLVCYPAAQAAVLYWCWFEADLRALRYLDYSFTRWMARACYLLLDWLNLPRLFSKKPDFTNHLCLSLLFLLVVRDWEKVAKLCIHVFNHTFQFCVTNHRITKWLRLEGTSGSHLVKHPCSSRAT